jgi:hypothetical protein
LWRAFLLVAPHRCGHSTCPGHAGTAAPLFRKLPAVICILQLDVSFEANSFNVEGFALPIGRWWR